MAFHDVRLPEEISQNAIGGPSFNTSIFNFSDGKEKRNINWENPRSQWDIGYAIRFKEDMDVVRDFFYARQGRLNTFRFKDWSDYQIGDSASSIPEIIGVGDGASTVFLALKIYKSGPATFTRKISKLVAGTARAFLDGVEQFAGFNEQPESGTITFTTPPAVGVQIGLIAEYDLHVRFNEDDLDIEMAQFDHAGVPNLTVIEERETLTVVQTPLFIEVVDDVTVGEVVFQPFFAFTVAIFVEDAVTIGEALIIAGIPFEIDTVPFNEDITVDEIVTVTLV